MTGTTRPGVVSVSCLGGVSDSTKQWRKTHHAADTRLACQHTPLHRGRGSTPIMAYDPQPLSAVEGGWYAARGEMCPPLCVGAMWPMPAWVWRDVQPLFFSLFLCPEDGCTAACRSCMRFSAPCRACMRSGAPCMHAIGSIAFRTGTEVDRTGCAVKRGGEWRRGRTSRSRSRRRTRRSGRGTRGCRGRRTRRCGRSSTSRSSRR